MNDVQPKSVLVVERADRGIADALAHRGFDVHRTAQAEHARSAVIERHFDACVIVALGDQEIDLCRAIRTWPRGARLPVVLVAEAEMLTASQAQFADDAIDIHRGYSDILIRVAELTAGATDARAGRPVPDPLSDQALSDSGPGRGEFDPGDALAAPFYPEPTADEAVERALAAAEAVGPALGSLSSNGAAGEWNTGNGRSLHQVIEQVEKRIPSQKIPAQRSPDDLPAELDALDIEADLGRPEQTAEVFDTSPEPRWADTWTEQPQDTKVTSPSTAPAREEIDAGTPEPSAPSGPDDSGELAATPIWTLLAGAYADKRSGVLVLKNPSGATRKLFFLDGDPVMTTSTAHEDRLVELLYREGRLSEEQYNHFAFTVGTSGRRVGAILVENGVIASRELFPLVRHHYESIIFDSFSWPEGSWHWEPGKPPPNERILLDVPTPMLIMEGIRSRARHDDVSKLMPLGAKPVKLPRGICDLEETGLLSEEIAVYEACDGSLTVAELATRFNLWDQDLSRIFAGLWVLGLLDAVEEHGYGDASGQTASPQRSQREQFYVDRARLSDKLAQIEEGSYFAILEVSPDASGYEIRKTYRRLRAQFAPERYAVPELADLRSKAELVRQVVDEAYEVLRNPVLRESYRQASTEGL